jgi:hypothetical protein
MVRSQLVTILIGSLALVIVAACSTVIASQPEMTPGVLVPTSVSTEIPTAVPLSQTPVETVTPIPTLTKTIAALTSTHTVTPTNTFTPTQTPTATPDTRLKADQWRAWPIVPTLSARALEIYRIGQKIGNNPKVFSRIGDCQSESAIMMGVYDNPRLYTLNPDYQHLQVTINQFTGSFTRHNMTVRQGFGIASVFNKLLADRQQCGSDETPLACEYRLSKPIIAIISMGTNWCAGCTQKYEEYLRKIVDFLLENGVIPVISTKADNIEKDWSINEAMARVAYDYDIPLWNFWRAVQYLPNHGLMPDNEYLTIPGWNERSFTGLQTLDAIWTAIQKVDEAQ